MKGLVLMDSSCYQRCLSIGKGILVDNSWGRWRLSMKTCDFVEERGIAGQAGNDGRGAGIWHGKDADETQ